MLISLSYFCLFLGKIQSAVETPTTQEKRSDGAATTGRKRRNRKALQTPKDSQNALDASVEKSESSKKGRPKHKVPAPILFSSEEDSDDEVFAPSQLKENAQKGRSQSHVLYHYTVCVDAGN